MSRDLTGLTSASADWSGLRAYVGGIGIAGFAAADALLSVGADVVVLDSADGDKQRERANVLEILGAHVRLGSSLVAGDDADVYVVSPGIPLHDPQITDTIARGTPVWGEMEIGWRMRRAEGAAPWLCVTGTNGKTTTTLMADSMLRAAGLASAAVGNIGSSIIDAVRRDDLDVLAVELSATQTPFAPSVSAEVAVCLNLAPDHLDFFHDFSEYAHFKSRVYHQAQLAAVYNVDDPATEAMVREADVVEGCRAIGFTLGIPGLSMVGLVDDALVDRAFIEDRRTNAQELASINDIPNASPANVANALAAAALVRAHGVSPAAVRDGLRAFTPAPHRVAMVREAGGVRYIDDSKATNTHAASMSLRAFDSVVWIAGGIAKGQSFDDLVAEAAPRLRGVVLIGTDRGLIRDALARRAPGVAVIEIAATGNDAMTEIVARAADLARPGDAVLMAPACASFDMFRDYGDRGDRFAQAVRALA